MKKIFFPFIIFLIFTFSVNADEFEVKKFEKAPKDISAISNSREDVNGDKCAIIKVLTDLSGLGFESNLGIEDIVKKPGEYWLYVSPGERRIRATREGFIPLEYNLPERAVEATVYRMVLTRMAGSGTSTAYTTGFVLLKSNPSGANVYIDGEFRGKTPLSKEMESGYYNYRLSSQYFYDMEGEFRVFIDSTNTIEVALDPNFGSLTVTNVPSDVPASISIDGVIMNLQTPVTIDTLQTGSHSITLQTDLYEPVSRDFEINDNEVLQLDIPLNPIFGNVSIMAGNTDDIYIDGELKATGNFSGILMVGIHTIEVKREQYYTETQKLNVVAGMDETLNIGLAPITGSLSIITDPPEADIIIDDVNRGKSPKIINDLLVGDYEISLARDGYATVKTTATINENERTTVNENLKNFREVRITSSPSNASLVLNGKNEGSTPKNLTLPFGQNSLKLTKAGYNNFKENFSVTEQKAEYNFTMVSDAKALAEVDFIKYKKRKTWWLAGTIVSAGAGAYFTYSSNKAGKDYATATTDATSLYDQMEQQRTISYAAFGVSGFCAIFTIINSVKQGKAKRKINIAAVPLEGGGMLSLQMKF